MISQPGKRRWHLGIRVFENMILWLLGRVLINEYSKGGNQQRRRDGNRCRKLTRFATGLSDISIALSWVVGPQVLRLRELSFLETGNVFVS